MLRPSLPVVCAQDDIAATSEGSPPKKNKADDEEASTTTTASDEKVEVSKMEIVEEAADAAKEGEPAAPSVVADEN